MCSTPAPQPDPELQTQNDEELRARSAEAARQRSIALGRSDLNLTGGLGDVGEAKVKSVTLGG